MHQLTISCHPFMLKKWHHQPKVYFSETSYSATMKHLTWCVPCLRKKKSISHLINSANLLSDKLEAIWMIPLRDLFFLFFCKAVMSFIVSFCLLVCEAVTLEAKQLSPHKKKRILKMKCYNVDVVNIERKKYCYKLWQIN